MPGKHPNLNVTFSHEPRDGPVRFCCVGPFGPIFTNRSISGQGAMVRLVSVVFPQPAIPLPDRWGISDVYLHYFTLIAWLHRKRGLLSQSVDFIVFKLYFFRVGSGSLGPQWNDPKKVLQVKLDILAPLKKNVYIPFHTEPDPLVGTVSVYNGYRLNSELY